MRKKALVVILVLGTAALAEGCRKRAAVQPEVPAVLKNIVFAGVRSSNYGIKPFPEPAAWQKAIDAMTGRFPGATPGAIWIVGELKRPTACRLFLKHWDLSWMPETYRGDIVFIDDGQEVKSLDDLLDAFQSRWADHFHPSPVFFQIGYNSDKPWWQNLDDPPLTIGRAIAQRVKQSCGIIWVDFSLRDVFKLSPE